MNNQVFGLSNIVYAKKLSTLFCSGSVVSLTVLCLLNTGCVDIYSLQFILKVVFPAGISFWFLGYIIGHIFDCYDMDTLKKMQDQKKAYGLPSMFSDDASADSENIEFGEL